ncbi:MAG: hypothetical protein M3N43_05305 [Actinomycetota bacterium]|nr:hypothetical protein [Actinomycetota bacterium]
MILTDLRCPIDDTELSERGILVDPGNKQTLTASVAVGKHVHLMANATLACLDGHSWKVSGGLTMERV